MKIIIGLPLLSAHDAISNDVLKQCDLLIKNGFDTNTTYFEYNIVSSEIPTIFIHGVGLDNTSLLHSIFDFHTSILVAVKRGNNSYYSPIKFLNYVHNCNNYYR